MIDYNDGKWHRWDGGKCPVHHGSTVDVQWIDINIDQTGLNKDRKAGGVAWRQVTAFRVTKAAPREWWIGNDVFLGLPDISDKPKPGYTHVKEVIE